MSAVLVQGLLLRRTCRFFPGNGQTILHKLSMTLQTTILVSEYGWKCTILTRILQKFSQTCGAHDAHRMYYSTHFAYPRRDGQAELAWVAGTYKDGLSILKMVTHPSTNRARRWLTSLMRPTTLPTKPNRHLVGRPSCNSSGSTFLQLANIPTNNISTTSATTGVFDFWFNLTILPQLLQVI